MENNNTNQNTAPKRKRKKKKGVTILSAITYVFVIFAVSAALAFFAIVLANDMFAFVKEDKTVTIEIQEGATVADVSEILESNEIIEYSLVFTLFTTLTSDNPDEINFIPGSHELNSLMDYRALMSELINSSRDAKRITIPEGYTISQIVDLLVSENISTEEKLMKVINEYPFKHEFLKEVPDIDLRLEGYLYPDTYDFYTYDESNENWDTNEDGIDDAAVIVINKMLNNFNSKYDEQIQDKANDLGITMHEAITIASMIEREAKLLDEQPMVSGVIHNRLNSSSFPYLQIDATLQYAMGHNNPLSREELESDHAYNTYTNEGLPPGPISSPGFDAIYSAVTPDSHSFYYYVATADGSHIFSETLEAHNAAIASLEQ